MSIRDLIALATNTTKKETVAPQLLTIALDLVQQLLDVCDNNNVRLDTIPAFSMRNNEWSAALIQIFAVFYRDEWES